MTNTLTTSNPLPYFNFAQTFKVDGKLFPNNTSVEISSVNVYFKYKPASSNNQSGIVLPGITVYVANTIFGVPLISPGALNNFGRCEWNQILTSSDGTTPTNFALNQPVTVDVNTLYALVLSFDGNEGFVPWTATSGYWLAGTTNSYSGTQNSMLGSYFQYADNGDPTANPENAVTQAQYQAFWTALNNTQLTFDVLAARYCINGVPVSFSNTVSPIDTIYSNNMLLGWNANTSTLTFSYPSNNPEAISFNLATSTVQQFIGAQRVYQNTFSWPGGIANSAHVNSSFVTCTTNVNSVLVTGNTSFPNGAAFNWNTIYPNLASLNYIVFQDTSGPNVRKVVAVVSNTVLQVDEPLTFTNAICQFMVTPAATVDLTLSSSPYGTVNNLLFLQGSSANSTVRFVNNCILSIAKNAGGTGYSNSDVLYVTGYEFVAGKKIGGYIAVANLITNSTGGIANLHLSNQGCGFTNASNILAILANSSNIGNTSANTSAGSGATFTYTIGATLATEQTTNIFQNCVVSNFNIDNINPSASIVNPIGTTYNMTLQTQYYMVPDNTVSGNLAFYVQPPIVTPVTLNQVNQLVANNPIAFVSFSNEFVTPFANGANNNLVNAALGYSNSIIVQVNTQTSANDDYLAVQVQSTPIVEFGHYIINNSYYNEYTNSGNAWARHLSTSINFQQFAEDLQVYLTVYQPINTGFQVFAKIQNSNDPQTFNNEDWTELQLIGGQNQVSSLSDPTDYIQLTYGFDQYTAANSSLGANVYFTQANAVTTTNASAVVTSSGFNANVVASTLVKIYQPLFPNTNFFIGEVVSANSTSITLDQSLSSNVNIGGNPALIGTGLALDVIGYPHQAFNNINNDNVVRYYNTSFMRYDGYNNLQLKVVFLSSAYSYIPQLVEIQALGVSA